MTLGLAGPGLPGVPRTVKSLYESQENEDGRSDVWMDVLICILPWLLFLVLGYLVCVTIQR